MTDDVEPTTPAEPDEPTPPAGTPGPPVAPAPAIARPPMPDLSALDATSRLIVIGAAVAIGVAIIGGLLKTWDSTDFLLLILAGGIAAGVAAWFTATAKGDKPSPLPLGSIELAGVAVLLALGLLRLIELIFDLDAIDGLGDVTDLVASVVLVGAAGAMGMAVLRRDPSLARLGLDRDQGTRIAAIGLLLLLAGWAINVSFGYWRMSGGTLSVALATFAFVAILTAPSWVKVLPGIPVAWVGVVFGVVVAFLAIGLWGSLGRLGEDVDLGLLDYLGFVLYSLGIVGIIAGGFLAGQAAMMAGRTPAAEAPPDGTTPPAEPPADAPSAAHPPAADPPADPPMPGD